MDLSAEQHLYFRMYNLCREFRCLPSQIYKEDPEEIKELLTILEAKGQYQEEQSNRARMKRK